MRARTTRDPAERQAASGTGSGTLQRLAADSPAVRRHAALQRLADGGAGGVVQLGRGKAGTGAGKGKLVETTGDKFKKKKKERREAERVETTLREQIANWLSSYGHAQARHVAMSTAALDARNIPLATTFEEDADLQQAALDVISANEQRLNQWYADSDDPRIELWCYRDEAVRVRGRRKIKRPEWHQHVNPPPPHVGFGDAEPEDLEYIVGVFDRDAWTGSPKGLVTCYPSETQPG